MLMFILNIFIIPARDVAVLAVGGPSRGPFMRFYSISLRLHVYYDAFYCSTHICLVYYEMILPRTTTSTGSGVFVLKILALDRFHLVHTRWPERGSVCSGEGGDIFAGMWTCRTPGAGFCFCFFLIRWGKFEVSGSLPCFGEAANQMTADPVRLYTKAWPDPACKHLEVMRRAARKRRSLLSEMCLDRSLFIFQDVENVYVALISFCLSYLRWTKRKRGEETIHLNDQIYLAYLDPPKSAWPFCVTQERVTGALCAI